MSETNYSTVQPNDPPYLRAALSMLGLSEIEGSRDEPKVLAMYAACGHPEVKHDEVAWCAAFAGWALKKGGLSNTGSLLAASYAKYGTALDKRKTIPRGAIAVWHREGGNHVNFVLHDDGHTVTCIGGNQGNGHGGGVTISTRVKAEALAYRMASQERVSVGKPSPRSDGVPAPKPTAPLGSRSKSPLPPHSGKSGLALVWAAAMTWFSQHRWQIAIAGLVAVGIVVVYKLYRSKARKETLLPTPTVIPSVPVPSSELVALLVPSTQPLVDGVPKQPEDTKPTEDTGQVIEKS